MIQETRIYQAFYTKSTPIVEYMVQKLSLKQNDKILEPCGGDGVFIDSLLEQNAYAHIDVCELNEESIKILNEKFSSFNNVKIRQCDTLLDNELIIKSSIGGYYDKIIANPPYGAWQDYEKRGVLKKLFPNIYAKETYALFLFRCIELLKEGGILTFIIPDTYLNLHMHKGIRKHILTKTKIVELALFPSSFFPGVNFGYANLSIITLKKCNKQQDCLDNHFNIVNKFKTVEQLSNIGESQAVQPYKQETIYANSDHAFFITENKTILHIIEETKIKIGDIASCVTGFYSGNDKIYLKVIDKSLKNSKNYETVEPELINQEYTSYPDILDGISSPKHFLSIVKGGNTKYLKPEGWYMDWSKDAVNHYKTDDKARFQNPQYYFRFGVGVPMISSSSITAALIEHKLFDQSIVGVFPNDESLTFYLLGFFNSPTCNSLIRTINPSANNPANYIKKIPFILPDAKSLQTITCLVKEIIYSIRQTGNYDLLLEERTNIIISELYGF